MTGPRKLPFLKPSLPIPLQASLLALGSLIKCRSVSPAACDASRSPLGPQHRSEPKLNECVEQRLNERTLTSLPAPTLGLNAWDTILMICNMEKGRTLLPQIQIWAVHGQRSGGGLAGGEWAGLLRTWLEDYGFPFVGRRPQQLPRGCPQPPSTASSRAWLPANTSSFRSQTTRLPALGGLPRDSTGGDLIHFCEPEACEGSSWISPGGVVNRTPKSPSPPRKRYILAPQQWGLSHSSLLLSPLPVSSCVCLSPFQSDTLFLPLPLASSAPLSPLFSSIHSASLSSFISFLHSGGSSFSLHPQLPSLE